MIQWSNSEEDYLKVGSVERMDIISVLNKYAITPSEEFITDAQNRGGHSSDDLFEYKLDCGYENTTALGVMLHYSKSERWYNFEEEYVGLTSQFDGLESIFPIIKSGQVYICFDTRQKKDDPPLVVIDAGGFTEKGYDIGKIANSYTDFVENRIIPTDT